MFTQRRQIPSQQASSYAFTLFFGPCSFAFHLWNLHLQICQFSNRVRPSLTEQTPQQARFYSALMKWTNRLSYLPFCKYTAKELPRLHLRILTVEITSENWSDMVRVRIVEFGRNRYFSAVFYALVSCYFSSAFNRFKNRAN